MLFRSPFPADSEAAKASAERFEARAEDIAVGSPIVGSVRIMVESLGVEPASLEIGVKPAGLRPGSCASEDVSRRADDAAQFAEGKTGQPGNPAGAEGKTGQPGNSAGAEGKTGQPGDPAGEEGKTGQPGNMTAAAGISLGAGGMDARIGYGSVLPDTIPVRKVELLTPEGSVLDARRRSITIEAGICPKNASDRELNWKVVKIGRASCRDRVFILV